MLPTLAEIETAVTLPTVEEMLAAWCRVETAAFNAAERAAVATPSRATYVEALPATKSCPKSSIRYTPSVRANGGLLRIQSKRLQTEYLLAEFPAANGRGFHFAKTTPGSDRANSSYSVFCATPGRGRDSCNCKGFTRHGHCKHCDAVRAILENGWA